MIVIVTTMAVSGLLFSFWGFAVDIAALLRLCKPGRCLLVSNSFHTDSAKLAIIVDSLTVFIYGFPINCCLTANGIPLGTTCILQNLVVTAGSGIPGGIVERGAGSISITNFKVSIQTVGAVHMSNLAFITGHEVLESCLIVLGCFCTKLKLRSVSLRLHDIPLDAIGCLHNGMGCIGFLIVSAVVPEGVSTVRRACFDHAVSNRSEHRAFLGAGECRCNKRCFCISAMRESTGITGIIIAMYGMSTILISFLEGICIVVSSMICTVEATGYSSTSLRSINTGIIRVMHFRTAGNNTSFRLYTCAADIAANKSRCLVRHLINTFRSARNEFRGSGHFSYAACEGRHLAGHPTARYERSTKLRYFCSSICGIRDDTVNCRYCHFSGTTGECDDITIGTGTTNKCSSKFRSIHCTTGLIMNTTLMNCFSGDIAIDDPGTKCRLLGIHIRGKSRASFRHFCNSLRCLSHTFGNRHLNITTRERNDVTVRICPCNECCSKFRSFHTTIIGCRYNRFTRDNSGHISSTNSSRNFSLTSQFGNKSGTSLGNLHTALSRCGNDMLSAGNRRHLPCSSYVVARNLIGNKLRHKAGSSLRYFHTVNGNAFTVERANGMRNITGITSEFSRSHISSSRNKGRTKYLPFRFRNRNLLTNTAGFHGGHNTKLARLNLLTDHARNGVFCGTSFRYMNSAGNNALTLNAFRHTGHIVHLIARKRSNTLRHCVATRNDTLADRYATNIALDTGYIIASGNNPFRLHTFGSSRYNVRLIAWEFSQILRSAFCPGNNVFTCRSTGSIGLGAGHISACTRFAMRGICYISIDAACIGLGIHAAKDGCIVESASSLTACHLIPLTAIRSGNNTVRSLRLFKLRSTVHIHIRFLTVWSGCCGTDTATRNLSPLHLEALHMGHVVAQGPICDVTGNGTGGAGRTGCYRRNGLTVQSRTVSCRDSTEGPPNKSSTAAEAHAGTAFDNSITNIGIGAESGRKTCSKSGSCCAGSGCGCTTTCTAKDRTCRSGTAANTGNDTGSHKQLHTHTGTGLSNIQTHGCQIAVEPLRTFQICQCTEHPEEDTSLSGCQCASIADELSHGRSKASQEPYVHHQKQQLRTYHTAPGLDHIAGGFGSSHRKCQG